MANFDNRDNRGGNNRFGGGRPTYGDNHSGKRDFSKKRWGDDRSGDRPVILHEATCAECGKACEVPFIPIQGKPVYCKECFNNQGGSNSQNRNGGGGDRFVKRDFNTRPTTRPQFDNRGNSDAVTRQLEAVNSKLERLIKIVETMAPPKTVEPKTQPKEIFASPIKEVPKKKSAKKTKVKA